MYVIPNTQRPESTLKKKSNSICFHAVCEAVVMGDCLTGHVKTHENPADIPIKVLSGGQKQDHLIKLIYMIYVIKFIQDSVVKLHHVPEFMHGYSHLWFWQTCIPWRLHMTKFEGTEKRYVSKTHHKS